MPGSADNAVCLRVYGAAELIALTLWNAELFAHAFSQIRAVLPAAGGAVLAGGDDLVVADDYRAVFAAQAGGTLQNGVGYIKIVILFKKYF